MNNKYFLNASQWTKENSKILGIPRPVYEVPKEYLKKPLGSSLLSKTKTYLHKKIPVPWQTEPIFSNGKQLGLILENEKKVYIDGRCAYCGILFKNKDVTVRWITVKGLPTEGGPNVLSDNYPFHPECMKQARRFCPFMRTTIDEEFEYGPFELLKLKAEKHIEKTI